jgi:hypothetical protein
MPTQTYTPIATYTVPSATASYTFTSIPSTHTDLILVFTGTMTSADYVQFQVGNGSVDTGSNYSNTAVKGNGTSASSSRSSNSTNIFTPEPMNTNQGNLIINFQNYANTTTYKTTVMRTNVPLTDGGATGSTSATVGLWRSTSAINTIKMYTYAGQTYAAGSTFTLYGIKAGSKWHLHIAN